MVAVEEWRECARCSDQCPLDRHHFAPTYTNRDGRVSYRRVCRRCDSERVKAHDRALRANPETREEYLAKRRAIHASYAERHPDKVAAWKDADNERGKTPEERAKANARRRERYARDIEASRERAREAYHADIERSRERQRQRYQRRKDDPERWARYQEAQRAWANANRERVRENHRIWVRLHAEQEGREFRKGKRREAEEFPPVSVVPIMPVIKRLCERYTPSGASAITGADHKVIKTILSGTGTITFDMADRICCRLDYNLWEFWPDA